MSDVAAGCGFLWLTTIPSFAVCWVQSGIAMLEVTQVHSTG